MQSVSWAFSPIFAVHPHHAVSQLGLFTNLCLWMHLATPSPLTSLPVHRHCVHSQAGTSQEGIAAIQSLPYCCVNIHRNKVKDGSLSIVTVKIVSFRFRFRELLLHQDWQ